MVREGKYGGKVRSPHVQRTLYPNPPIKKKPLNPVMRYFVDVMSNSKALYMMTTVIFAIMMLSEDKHITTIVVCSSLLVIVSVDCIMMLMIAIKKFVEER